jgi:parvulin-like peptidyl-prolyl isomerase
MKKILLLLPLAALAQDPVILTIGSEKITRSEWERFIDAMPERVRAEVRGPGKRKLAEQYTEIRALAQEARARKLDQTPAAKMQIALQMDNLLANLIFQDLQANAKADDAAVRAWFDQHKSEYEELTASHILVRFQGSRVPLREGQKDLTDAEALERAQTIRKKITAGGDFAAIAKVESDDVTSAKDGGALGTFGRGRMVPQFDEVAFKQPAGELSQPVRTQFGYHLIKVESRTAKKLEDVRPEIEQKMRPELAQKAIAEIRQKAGIVIDEAYFGK